MTRSSLSIQVSAAVLMLTLVASRGVHAAATVEWVDPSPSPPVASAPLPPREPVTPPPPPEPPSAAKVPESPAGTEASAPAPRAEKPNPAAPAHASSRPQPAKPSPHPLRSEGAARLPTPEASPLTARATAFINSYWQTVSDSGDRVLPYLSLIYAPMVTYYGKLLPKQTILQDKYYFIKRWPIRQTWPSPGAESPSISCNEVEAECVITGVRDFNAVNAERGARATGVVRYRYTVRFVDGWPQIVVEDSKIVARG